MKKILLQLPLYMALGLILTFSSCKKSSTTTPDDSTTALDATIVGTAANDVSNDASVAADQTSQISRGTGSAWLTICGATVDTSSGSIVITYDGTTHCSGLIRSGTVTVTLASGPWSQPNAQVLIAINVTATDVVSGNKYSLVGTDTITNELGGLVYNVLTGSAGPVNRRYSGSMQITFPSGGTRTWTSDRTISWTSSGTYPNNIVSTSIYSEAPGNIAASGTDRYGREFTSAYTDPILDNDHTCSGIIYAYPYSGLVTHTIGGNRVVTVLYGANIIGNSAGYATYCPGTNAYGIFLSYTNNKTGVAATLFVPYW